MKNDIASNVMPNQELTLISESYCKNISSLYNCYLTTAKFPHVIILKDSVLIADFHTESLELNRLSKNKFTSDGLDIIILSSSNNNYILSINGEEHNFCSIDTGFKNHIFTSIGFESSILYLDSNEVQHIRLKIIDDSFAEVEGILFEYSIQTNYTTDTVEYDRVLFKNDDSLFLCRMWINNQSPVLYIE